MTILRILQYPDPRLKTPGRIVEVFDDQLQKIIADMFETHYNAQNCAALAATQLDIPNPPHITVIDFSTKKNQPLCLINAKIVDQQGETYEEEGCMSVGSANDKLFAKVKRAAKISVQAQNAQGQIIEFTADGFMAKCIQHELDHLQGKIFIDHLSQLKRQHLIKKLKEKK